MKSYYFIFVFLFCHFSYSFSQGLSGYSEKINTHNYLTIRFHDGLVVPHHTSMLYLIEDFSRGFEINYGRRIFDEDNWRSFFNYPEIGLGFHYGTFGNNEVYGVGYALFHYVNYSIFRSQRLSINNKMALGIGYNTKPFDINNNIYNDISGSHFNIFIGLGLNMDYRFSKRISLSVSGDLSHMSNGAVKRPNSGFNTITASLGTKYHFNTANIPNIKKVRPSDSDKNELLIVGNVGRSQCAPFNSQQYWNGSISINYLYHLNQKKAIGIGFDQFYSEAAPYAWGNYDNRYKPVDYSPKQYLFNGLFASYNVFLGHTTMFVNLGVYLSSGVTPPQPIYPRVGVRHQFSRHLVASFGVKASFVRSEFLEFGLGYNINLSKTH